MDGIGSKSTCKKNQKKKRKDRDLTGGISIPVMLYENSHLFVPPSRSRGFKRPKTERELFRKAEMQAARKVKRKRQVCWCPCIYSKYDRKDLIGRGSGEVRVDPKCSNERVFDYTDHESYILPDDPTIGPFTILIEEICYLLRNLNLGIRQSMDMLTIPYA